jgi:hypothetical protein
MPVENRDRPSTTWRTMSVMARVGRFSGPRGGVSAALRAVVVLLLLVLTGVVAGRVVVFFLAEGERDRSEVPRGVVEPSVTGGSSDWDSTARGVRRAARVLHGWDADRAAAYARGDPSTLRRLYLPGSRAGVRDVRVLRVYAERGLVVRGLRTQVLALHVRSASRTRLELEVTDRLVGGRAVERRSSGDAGVSLPSDVPTTRVLVLRRESGEWRMRSVRAT